MRETDPLARALLRDRENHVVVTVGNELFVLKSWKLREGPQGPHRKWLDTEWERAYVVPQSVTEANSDLIRSLYADLASQ